MTYQLARRPFTTSEYHRLIEVGILTEDDRVELISGEVIKMAPIGPRRAACVDRLGEHLRGKIGRFAIVRTQNPIFQCSNDARTSMRKNILLPMMY